MKRLVIVCALVLCIALAGSVHAQTLPDPTAIQNIWEQLIRILRSTGFGSWVPAPYPFGGQVSIIERCDNATTTPNIATYLIHVGPPNPGEYIVITPNGTQCYAFGCPGIFGWVLGGASDFAVCDTDLGKGVRNVRARVILAQPGVGSSGQGNTTTAAATSTAQCSIKFKPGAGTQLKPDIKKSLEGYCSTAAPLDWQVTEGCPNTTTHQHPCHSQCTCVDIGFTDRQYTPDKVKKAIEAGTPNLAHLVFETNDKALYDSLIAAGLPASNVKYFPQVTGSHFSYYCPTCKP